MSAFDVEKEAVNLRAADMRTKPMSPREFKYGLLKLADPNDKRLISEQAIARRLAAIYIEADEDTQRQCSFMLRFDLAAIRSGEEPQS